MNASYDMYSCPEAAKMIGVHPTTLHRWIKLEHIHCKDVGNGSIRGRYEFSDIDIEMAKKFRDSHFKGKDLGTMSRKGPRKRKVAENNLEVEEKKESTYTKLLEENRQLRLEIERLRKEKEAFISSMLELMAKYE